MTPLQLLEARVGAFLGQLGLGEAHRPGAVTAVDAGEVVVLVTCFEQDEATWTRIAAVLRTDVVATVDLLLLLQQLDHDVLLGGFHLFEDGTLAFSVTHHGPSLDPDAFALSLRYVARAATQASRALDARVGGRSWSTVRQEAAAC